MKCPKCGYCEHCGRSEYAPAVNPWPWQQPVPFITWEVRPEHFTLTAEQVYDGNNIGRKPLGGGWNWQ